MWRYCAAVKHPGHHGSWQARTFGHHTQRRRSPKLRTILSDSHLPESGHQTQHQAAATGFAKIAAQKQQETVRAVPKIGAAVVARIQHDDQSERSGHVVPEAAGLDRPAAERCRLDVGDEGMLFCSFVMYVDVRIVSFDV